MKKVWSALFVFMLGCMTPAGLVAEKEERVMVIKGHSQIVEFGQPITRIAITEPEIGSDFYTDAQRKLIDQFFLIRGEISDGHSRKRAVFPLQGNAAFFGSLFNQSLFDLLDVQGFENLVGFLCLVVIDVLFGITLPVAVHDRPAERHVFDVIAIGPQCEVPSG